MCEEMAKYYEYKNTAAISRTCCVVMGTNVTSVTFFFELPTSEGMLFRPFLRSYLPTLPLVRLKSSRATYLPPSA